MQEAARAMIFSSTCRLGSIHLAWKRVCKFASTSTICQRPFRCGACTGILQPAQQHQTSRHLSGGVPRNNSVVVLFTLLLLLSQLSVSSAYVYLNNNATYSSLPALFGRFMLDGKIYDARLQYFHENPYLCELDDKITKNFVVPMGPQIPVFNGVGNNLSHVTLYAEAVVVLASRGNCPFQRKAAVAESIHESVKFLMIANFNVDNTYEEEETLVPMYSQFGTTRLVMLSISHATGQALKKYLSEQPAEITAIGGPIVLFDSEPPMGLLTADDLQSMVLSALGLFFMLISFTGCLVILAGTYSQIANQHGGSGNSIMAATQRRLLTEEEVHQLTAATAMSTSDIESTSTALSTSNAAATTSGLGGRDGNVDDVDNMSEQFEEEEDQCAVCLGDFDADSSTTALPCKHKFHTDCILPWLTERQSKCPLCKFDVLQHIREQQQAATNNATHNRGSATGSASLWDQLRRYRWTSVRILEDGEHHLPDTGEGSSHAVNLRLDEDPGVELTEQGRIS